jgi:flavin reductase (DIM6/NTAB) family NADH-FMN oxidoreductase RutF
MPVLLAEEIDPGRMYGILAGWVVPRPIALVSTVSASGIRNLAPFSYFMPGGVNPPSLCFCPIISHDGADKDTLSNIQETKEFVVNLVSRAMAEGMNETSPQFPAEVDEWIYSGFTPAPCVLVTPERAAEAPVSFECRLHAVTRHGEGPLSSAYVSGEILAVHASEGAWQGLGEVKTIARLGGAEYLDMDGGKLFELHRPKSAS